MHMMGYNIDWASFNIVEVMASKKFSHKRIGYLAAAQSFTPETDVLMLTTNMVKKVHSFSSLRRSRVVDWHLVRI